MESLSDENLLETYKLALELDLEEAFIQMLLEEMDRWGLGNRRGSILSDEELPAAVQGVLFWVTKR